MTLNIKISENKQTFNQKLMSGVSHNALTDTYSESKDTGENYKIVKGSPFYQFIANADYLFEQWKKGLYPLDDVYPTDPRSDNFITTLLLGLEAKTEEKHHFITFICNEGNSDAYSWMLNRFDKQKWHDYSSMEIERLLIRNEAFNPFVGTHISKHIWDKDEYTYILCEDWSVISEIKKMPMAKKDTCMVDCSFNFLPIEEQKKLFDVVCDELLKKGIEVMNFIGISERLQNHYYFNVNPVRDENGKIRKAPFAVRIFLKTQGVEYGVKRMSFNKMEECRKGIRKLLKRNKWKFPQISSNPFFDVP